MAFSYKAFITYCHEDSKFAAWLQRKLESYNVPSRLVGRETAHGKVPARLRPIFRDREELSAGGHLGDTINSALENSEFLICICSPAARESKWVNLEIAAFRRLHGDRRVLCVIADGEPYVASDPARAHLECMPPALGLRDTTVDEAADSSVEHVAADARAAGDGRKAALLKTIAGLIGVGLDEVVQRDAQRRMLRMLGLSAVSGAGMIAMSIMAFIAIEARDAEQQRRADAEDLIEFMLTDLRDRLEPVGRLDALDAVGKEAIDYYSRLDLADHTADSLGRRARAFHLLGEVDDLRGDLQQARSAFNEAYDSTGELLRRYPDSGQRMYDHAQSVFWLGYLDWQLGNMEAAKLAFQEYVELANRMNSADPRNVDWLAERGHANINMGVYSLETGSAGDAIAFFETAQSVFSEAAERDADNPEWQVMVAQAHAWAADAYQLTRDWQRAIDHRATEAAIYIDLLVADPANNDIRQKLIASHNARADLSLDNGAIDASISELDAGIRYGSELMRLDPENTLTTYMTALAHVKRIRAEWYAGEINRGRQHLAEARRIIAGLLKRNDLVLEWQLLDIEARLLSSWHLAEAQGDEEGRQQLVSLDAELRTLVDGSPDATEARLLHAEVLHYLSSVNERQGDNATASRVGEQIIAELEPLENQLPPKYLALLARALEHAGDVVRAGQLWARLESMHYRHPEFGPAAK